MSGVVPAAKYTRLTSPEYAFRIRSWAGFVFNFQSYGCGDTGWDADNDPPVAICPPSVMGFVNLAIGVHGDLSYAVVTGASISSYAWSWGDGGADGSGIYDIHTYTATGTYTITQTVTDDGGRIGSCSYPIEIRSGSGDVSDCLSGDYLRALIVGDDAGYGYWTPDSGANVTTYNFSREIRSVSHDPVNIQTSYLGDISGTVHTTWDGLATIAYTLDLGSSVESLWTDQVNRNVVWAGLANGTLIRSEDWGVTVALTNPLGWDGGIKTIITDPFNPQRIIIGGKHGDSARLAQSLQWGATGTFDDIRSGDVSNAEAVNEVQFSNANINIIWVALDYSGSSAGVVVQKGVRNADESYTFTAGDTIPETEALGISSRLYEDDMAYAVTGTVEMWKTADHPTWATDGSGTSALRQVRSDSGCADLLWLGAADGVHRSLNNGVSTELVFATNGAVNDLQLGPLGDPTTRPAGTYTVLHFEPWNYLYGSFVQQVYEPWSS